MKAAKVGQATRLGVWFVGSAEEEAHRFLGEQISFLRVAAEKCNLGLDFLFSSSADEIPSEIVERKVHALILQGLMPKPHIQEKLKGLPHVWVMTRRAEDYPGDFVEPDNEANGRMAADYLADREHRSVAFVTTEPDYPAFARREAAFVKRCGDHKMKVSRVVALPQDPKIHLRMPPSDADIDQLVAKFVKLPQRPTALYLPGDLVIGGLHRGLRRAGLNPGDFDWIIGHFNPYLYSQLDLRVAAIDINPRSIVTAAVYWASWRLQNPSHEGRIGVQVGPSLHLP